MQLENFYGENSGKIHFTRKQASDFAKQIAGDFNPIHDEDAKRFCVPGDLLFALLLKKYGISQQMRITFAGMVSDGIALHFNDTGGNNIAIVDDKEKEYLNLAHSGETSRNTTLINNLICRYVEFSGQTFPHILVPLMKEHNVMINPARPLVIYESMVIDIDNLNIEQPELALSDSTLEVNGKRGSVCLMFNLLSNGNVIGKGEKNMVLSGLREYDEARVQQLVNDYDAQKSAATR
ncbi:MAG: DUF3581 domain-containing protein [Thiotrichaceae bacterium]|nr:DUF3581 domain-containing protein [Thiotrichaceae bacterium]PCI11152.1 MAG: hypothetical protein COB71_11995 [Thiotrichales bacterium]PCI12874.1 MAG: hypothetical protein COB71_07710 [Thiotrichales bacterium]